MVQVCRRSDRVLNDTCSDTGPGFALGGFFSLMSATFAYEDPLSRAARDVTGTKAQTIYVMKEMGRNMWSSGKGFAKVGALYAGVECCIEGVSTDLILNRIELMTVPCKTRHDECCFWRICDWSYISQELWSNGYGWWWRCICSVLRCD